MNLNEFNKKKSIDIHELSWIHYNIYICMYVYIQCMYIYIYMFICSVTEETLASIGCYVTVGRRLKTLEIRWKKNKINLEYSF